MATNAGSAIGFGSIAAHHAPRKHHKTASGSQTIFCARNAASIQRNMVSTKGNQNEAGTKIETFVERNPHSEQPCRMEERDLAQWSAFLDGWGGMNAHAPGRFSLHGPRNLGCFHDR